MAAHSANRMQIVVLRMALFTKSGRVIPAPRTPFTIAATCALRTFSFFICDCNHELTYWKYLPRLQRGCQDDTPCRVLPHSLPPAGCIRDSMHHAVNACRPPSNTTTYDHSSSGGQILEAPIPAPCTPASSLQSALVFRNLMKCGVWAWA